MAWTELIRAQYVRSGGRYASDASDGEWALIAALLPARRRIGRPRTLDLRDVFDAILYIATTGCQWRMLPVTSRPSRQCDAISMTGAATVKQRAKVTS